MTKPNRIPNFKKMYPEANESVIETLKKSERKMQYQEYDLKAEQVVTDDKGQTVILPAREDSIERLEENGVQFFSDKESIEDMVIKREEIEQLYQALSMLSKEEQELIHALYFEKQTERELAQKMGVYRNAIHKRKKQIEKKLKNILKNLRF